MNRFPIYIVSKGRHDTRMTARYLDAMHVEYLMIVEAQELELYAAKMPREKLLVLDRSYQDRYETCDALGDTKSKGPGAARNFAWDHAIARGAEWHWVMDDNIQGFYRLNRNTKIQLGDGTCFKAMEDFCLRYTNLVMAGPNYESFAARRQKHPPFVANTRIYSCNLIRNNIPFRWRGRYNEDTDLSLRILKAGFCTVQFNAFLQNKIATQTVPGGNHADFYEKEGTAPKSRMLYELHPDVTRLVRRWDRDHHYVDYSGFRRNRLIKREGVEIAQGVDEFGMQIVQIDKSPLARP